MKMVEASKMKIKQSQTLANPHALVLLLLLTSMILMLGIFPFKVRCSKLSNNTDMLALLSFKGGIKEDPFQVLSSWNHSLHFFQWEGVACSRRHQRVIALNLTSQKLSGSLSPAIGNLSFLRVLDLSANQLTELPQEVAHLFRLRVLYLTNNSFQGVLPGNLTNFSQLRVLALGGNNFTGYIPLQFGSLRKLTHLDVTRNYLSGAIPSSLGNLTALETISMAENQLTGGIPGSFHQLKSLTFLGLCCNMLSGLIPSSIYNLSNLAHIHFGSNRFEGHLPRDLGHKLPNIEFFVLWENQLSGTIPVSLSNSSNLGVLDLGDNNFYGKVPIDFGNMKGFYFLCLAFDYLGNGEADDLGFITSLTNCSDLETLDLSGNKFGVLPNSVVNLSTNLAYFSVKENQISGNIPQDLGNLVGLQKLAISDNRITGVIPETIGRLHNLQKAMFMVNNLTGVIPFSIGNLTNLTHLQLEYNNLEGIIPLALGNCSRLLLLHLSSNQLTGDIPPEVIGLSSIAISLDLSRNRLSGLLPLEVGNLKNLGELDVSHNELSGEIPSSLGACTSLERLYMNDNHFKGSIPSSFSSLRAIEELDLSMNYLSGELPKSLATFSLLRELNLSFNDFKGPVPLRGVFVNISAVSVVGNKRLCGGIADLHLPKCNANESKKHLFAYLRILIPVIGGLLGLASTLIILIFYKNKQLTHNQRPAFSLVNPLMNLSYGDIFRATDGFSPLNLIGLGGFGSVYKGVLHPNNQVVAVKVLNLQNERAARSFMDECEALRNIRHRNLVKVITACSSIDFQGNDFKALVYEFMPNGSLDSWLHHHVLENNADDEEPRTLSLSQRLSIVVDVATALDYLHNHSEVLVIHRDLKPSNILLDNNMTAYVSDFGLAKIIMQHDDEQLEDHCTSSNLKGTIGYAPPEYGIGSAATTRGDEYSFGILILEIFTGKRPVDSTLVDGSNLHEMSKTSLLNRTILKIIDHALQPEVEREGIRAGKCLTAMLEIGVACSMEFPGDRMHISDVVNKVRTIRELFLKPDTEHAYDYV